MTRPAPRRSESAPGVGAHRRRRRPLRRPSPRSLSRLDNARFRALDFSSFMSAPLRGMLLSVIACIAANQNDAFAVDLNTPYCRQVRARAQSDADLLMMPRVLVQGIRFPKGAQQFDSGATTDQGYQLR